MKNTVIYNELVQKMRKFFLKKGFIEVPTQSRLSILAACENPHSIATFTYQGEVWPLPQTGQMWLEYELLKKIKSIFIKEYDDKKLREYRYEMNNMSNDGWTMKHYKTLYKQRLKKLR